MARKTYWGLSMGDWDRVEEAGNQACYDSTMDEKRAWFHNSCGFACQDSDDVIPQVIRFKSEAEAKPHVISIQ